MIDTNWYVITGCPSSGKTDLCEYLAFFGYDIQTVPEAARVFIHNEKSKGKKKEKIRADEIAFQKRILEMKIWREERTPTQQFTVWERGIPDSIAYYRLYGENANLPYEASKKRRYKGVFLLDLLPYERDDARTETEEQRIGLQELLFESYLDLGYRVIKVPKMPIDERANFLLSKISGRLLKEP